MQGATDGGGLVVTEPWNVDGFSLKDRTSFIVEEITIKQELYESSGMPRQRQNEGNENGKESGFYWQFIICRTRISC
jgi:hypothetical protein